MATDKYLLSIDVGTTNCKSIVFDKNGRPVGFAYKELSNIRDRLGPGWVEQDALAIWNAVCETTNRVLHQHPDVRGKIAGVGVTTLRQSILPVDKDGEPLRYILPWNIRATRGEAKWIKEHISEEKVYRITGVPITPLWTMPSFIYMKQKESQIHRKAYKFLEVQDFVLHKLGVEDFVTDYSQASCTSLFDIHALEWSRELCEFVDVPLHKLPRVVPPGTLVGKVSKTAARLTSLIAGTPLCIAGGDSQVSALGCGVTEPGTANVVIGTSAVANAFIDNLILDTKRVLVCHPHAYSGKYVLDHNTLTGGNAYRWFRDNFYPIEKTVLQKAGESTYKLMNAEIVQVPAGANGVLFLPHLVGAASPYWDDSASGCFLGITLSTTRSEILQSVIEGICLEVRKGFELMSQFGVEFHQVRVSGGACCQDSPWNQIQADVYGKTLLVLGVEDTTALGAAMLTSVAVDIWESIPIAAKNMVKISREVKPNPENHEKYTRLLDVQDQAYRSLSDAKVYNKIEELRRGS